MREGSTPSKVSSSGRESEAPEVTESLDDVDARLDRAEILELLREDQGEAFVQENEALILLDARRLSVF